MFGFATTSAEAQTWEWNGAAWSRLSLGVEPSSAAAGWGDGYGTLLYDAAQQRIVVVFDGVMWRLEP